MNALPSQEANDAVDAMTKRAHGKDEEESSTSDRSSDQIVKKFSEGGVEVIQEAKKFGLTVEELPPGSESKEEVLDQSLIEEALLSFVQGES